MSLKKLTKKVSRAHAEREAAEEEYNNNLLTLIKINKLKLLKHIEGDLALVQENINLITGQDKTVELSGTENTLDE